MPPDHADVIVILACDRVRPAPDIDHALRIAQDEFPLDEWRTEFGDQRIPEIMCRIQRAPELKTGVQMIDEGSMRWGRLGAWLAFELGKDVVRHVPVGAQNLRAELVPRQL